MNMRNLFCAIGVIVCACVCGCVKSAGGKYIWWSDREHCQVGDKDTYKYGETAYDPATGKDVPKDKSAAKPGDAGASEPKTPMPPSN